MNPQPERGQIWRLIGSPKLTVKILRVSDGFVWFRGVTDAEGKRARRVKLSASLRSWSEAWEPESGTP